jgi:hypothetical protein
MAFAQRVRILNEFPLDYAGEYLVRFGRVDIPGTVPQERRHDLPAPSREAVGGIAAVPAMALAEGLMFLVDAQGHGLDMGAVQAVQKEYLYRYYKEIVLPRLSPLAAAGEGVRPHCAPEIVRMMSVLHNIPYLLRYPLTQSLLRQDCRQPVLLLLPGPSLAAIGPWLRELADHFVVGAIARTLGFCLEQGVEPDFVVQLDTFLLQQHFYDALPALPHTVLVALSLSPIHRIAHKFRGVLFMDSFNLAVVQNQYRMRENGLSSLMACMGLAECLQAPCALLAGADLSFPKQSLPYQPSGNGVIAPELDAPAYVQTDGHDLFVGNRAGKGVLTTLNYFAAAREAEHFAEQIGVTTATRFHVTSDDGILSPEHFSRLDREHWLRLPRVNRELLRSQVDNALVQSENAKLARLKVDCTKTMEALDHNLLFLESCRLRGSTPELEHNPIRLFADQERDFNLPPDPELRLAFSLKIARQWRQAANQAHNVTLAHMLARRQGAIPLLCLPGEAESLLPGLERLFPGFRWDVRPVTNVTMPKPRLGPHDLISTSLHRSLPTFKVAFVSPAVKRTYQYHFDVYGGDNLFFLTPPLLLE